MNNNEIKIRKYLEILRILIENSDYSHIGGCNWAVSSELENSNQVIQLVYNYYSPFLGENDVSSIHAMQFKENMLFKGLNLLYEYFINYPDSFIGYKKIADKLFADYLGNYENSDNIELFFGYTRMLEQIKIISFEKDKKILKEFRLLQIKELIVEDINSHFGWPEAIMYEIINLNIFNDYIK